MTTKVTSVKVGRKTSEKLDSLSKRHRLSKMQLIELAVYRLSAVPVQERCQIVEQFAAKESDQCGTTDTRQSSTDRPSTSSSKTCVPTPARPRT